MRKMCSKIVVIVYSGRPIDLRGLLEEADAVVAAWLPGTEAGAGIVDVLSGDVGFSGKSSYTWPRSFYDYRG